MERTSGNKQRKARLVQFKEEMDRELTRGGRDEWRKLMIYWDKLAKVSDDPIHQW